MLQKKRRNSTEEVLVWCQHGQQRVCWVYLVTPTCALPQCSVTARMHVAARSKKQLQSVSMPQDHQPPPPRSRT